MPVARHPMTISSLCVVFIFSHDFAAKIPYLNQKKTDKGKYIHFLFLYLE